MIIEDLMLDLMYNVPSEEGGVRRHPRGRRGQGEVDHPDREGWLGR